MSNLADRILALADLEGAAFLSAFAAVEADFDLFNVERDVLDQLYARRDAERDRVIEATIDYEVEFRQKTVRYLSGRVDRVQMVERDFELAAILERRKSELRPPLPLSLEPSAEDGLYGCDWLNHYIEHSRIAASASYDSYHELCAIWILSAVSARRVYTQFGHDVLYGNLYMVMHGASTMFHKSTAANVAITVMNAAKLHHLVLDSHKTPEKFLSDCTYRARPDYFPLTDSEQNREIARLRFASVNAWYLDEFGQKLKSMLGTGKNSAYYHLLLKMADAHKPLEQATHSRQTERIEQPYLSLLGCATPPNFRRIAKADSDSWGDGFFARFLFASPPVGASALESERLRTPLTVPADIIDPLKEWHRRLGIPHIDVYKVGEKHDAHIKVDHSTIPRKLISPNDRTFSAYNAYGRALRGIVQKEIQQHGDFTFAANYARLPDQAMRVALLFASIGNCEAITMVHWRRAVVFAERCREALHQMIEQISMPTVSEQVARQEQILRAIKRIVAKGEPATFRRISRSINRGVKAVEFADISQQLIKLKLLRQVEAQEPDGTAVTAFAPMGMHND